MMPDAIAVPRPKRRTKPPYVPSEAHRQVISMLASVNISQEAMAALLKANGAGCSVPTLKKAFKQELALGRELAVAKLAGRMFSLAMSDKPQAFSALAFLLRTIGGPEWRRADPRGDEAPPAADGDADTGNPNVHFYLPSNGRDRPAEDDPPVIEGEVDAEDAA
jgi:hypothetical protein